MIETVSIARHTSLEDYESMVFFANAVRAMRLQAAQLLPQLGQRTVWMLSSTPRGGAIAEMMPGLVGMFRDLGVRCEWLVTTAGRPEFKALTRRLHDSLHGRGDPNLEPADRELYENVSRDIGAELGRRIGPHDLLVAHDLELMGAGAMIAAATGVTALWRGHIGCGQGIAGTRAAWDFLKPYGQIYTRGILPSVKYAPDCFAQRVSIVPPSIDPLDHKNRGLTPHKLMGVLCNSRLSAPRAPVLTPPFAEPARRLGADGVLRPADDPEDVELMYRPMVTQVSRWDKLKGFGPLMEGFARLKRTRGLRARDEREARRLEIVRLLLAGPDPASTPDDPTAISAFRDVALQYAELETELKRDIALLVLPMSSRKCNALMVNALQRCSVVIVQNSLSEGFGLTATEAMWKGVPVLVSNAHGLALQVREGIDGRVLESAENPDEIADTLAEMLAEPWRRDALGRSAKRRVFEEFLLFRQVECLLRAFADCIECPLDRTGRSTD